MTTSELIAALRKADPEGDTPVCVGSHSLSFVERLPSYYDGAMQEILCDEAGRVVGARYRRQGYKVRIHTAAIADVLGNQRDLPVDYSQLNEPFATRYRESDNKCRALHTQIERDEACDTFLEWAAEKGRELTSDDDCLSSSALAFFDTAIWPDGVATEPPEACGWIACRGHVPESEKSGRDRRRALWDAIVDVAFDGMDWHFSLRERAKDAT